MKVQPLKLGKQNRNNKKNTGQALVEAVIIIPIAIFLILITVQIALLYNNYIILNYAVYCGARARSVHFAADPSDFEKASNIAKKAVRTVLISYSPVEAFLARIEVNIDSKTFSVKVIYPARLIVKLFGILPNVQITANSRMVVEGI